MDGSLGFRFYDFVEIGHIMAMGTMATAISSPISDRLGQYLAIH
jgi:hypothetical protein